MVTVRYADSFDSSFIKITVMRRIMTSVIVSSLSLMLYSQENNSFNYRGLDFSNAINLVAEDIHSGVLADYSEETIRSYSSKLPIKNEVTEEMIAKIFKTIKSSDFDVSRFLEGSTIPIDEFKKRLMKLTEEVQSSKMTGSHKEFILSVIAIANHGDQFSATLRGGPKERDCYITGPDGDGILASGTTCVLLGAITGAWIGFEICGIWCMVGGAIVGGIIGGLS